MSLAKLNDWKELRLDEVFDISRGGSPRPIKDFITESNEGYNWIKIGDTKKVDKYIYTTKQKIKKEGLKKTVLVQEDDFILSNSMSFGKPYIMKTEGCIHDGWLLMRRKSKDLSIDYMYYLLSSNVIKSQFKNKAAGSTVQNLNIKLVSTVKALIPSYKEQQKIAEILSTVDAKIKVIDQQITETQELKKGLMQRLLTKGIGHTEFKESPLGEIPVGWEVLKIGEVCQSFAGGTPKRSVEKYYLNGNIPWVKSGEVDDNDITYTQEFVTELAIEETSTKLIKPNSILVALYGATAGKIGVLKMKACSNQAVLAINSKNENLSNKFIYHYLKNITKLLLDLCQGSGQPNLSKKIIDNVFIPIPSVKEQQKIADILSAVDEKLDVLSEKKTTYQELKKGLMQQLLTGKVRVMVKKKA